MEQQHILITIGETDKIIGSPTYGQPLIQIAIKGIDNRSALRLISSLQVQLSNEVIGEVERLEKRIMDLTKLNIEK